MKITLIKPHLISSDSKTCIPSDRMQPLALAILAGLTPPEHKVTFYDDRLEKIPFAEPADLAGITVETHAASRSYELAGQFRRRGIPVVLGGFHPTLVPGEAIQYADSVVIGEAEGVWDEVLGDARKKNLKKFYQSRIRPSLAGLRPRREIFEGKKYLPLTLIEFGRGCRYNCDFCAVGPFYRHSYIHRPVDEVIQEIKKRDKNTTLFFTDDNIISDQAAAKELFRALVSLKVRWAGQASLDAAGDEELLRLMSLSGCYCLVVGLESLSLGSLKQMNKTVNIAAGNYEVILKKIYRFGIKVYATFVFGYDDDDADAFKKILNFAFKNKFFIANFNHLMPYPGTALYDRLLKQGRLLYEKWWLDSSYRFGHAVFMPRLISPEELWDGCIHLRLKFNGLGGILRRALDFKVNCRNIKEMIEFFSYNFLCRRGIVKKQNMRLAEFMSSY